MATLIGRVDGGTSGVFGRGVVAADAVKLAGLREAVGLASEVTSMEQLLDPLCIDNECW